MTGVVAVAAALTLGASGLLLALDRDERSRAWGLLPLVVLAPLSVVIARGLDAPLSWAPLAAGLTVALLSRAREDVLHSECALKMLWVLVTAFALSWTGLLLLIVVTGSAIPVEQWAALAVGLDPPLLWRMALPLGLLAGIVLLGGAPFHFWSADLLQGSRAWLGPIAVTALQVSGVAWMSRRLEAIHNYPEAASLASGILGIAAGAALVVGGLTLLWQRRPERRIGTLASLHGGLALASLAAASVSAAPPVDLPGILSRWSAHLVLALGGAATLARLVPVPVQGPAAPVALFRRHPWSGAAGLYALASLAGMPGTPGALVWLDTAKLLAASGSTTLLLALGFAWVASFAYATGQVREAFGVALDPGLTGNPVPRSVRASLWIGAGGLAALGVLMVMRRV